MRTFLLVCLIGLGLSLIAFGLVTPGDRDAYLEPQPPAAALLLDMENNLRTFGSAVRELVRGLIEEAISPYRQRLRHERPAQAPPP
jgi:hypothetical protein